MMKIVTTALVAVSAVAALSACNIATSSDAAGKSHHSTTNKPGDTKSSKPAPSFTVAQQNAITSAKQYLSISGFSRAGLIAQLSSKAADGYKLADAVFAVNHITVDWNAEAVKSAKQYLSISGFSRAGLIGQLTSKAGDGYTLAQATYAANHVGL